MKKIFLPAAGLIPFALGFGMNARMMANMDLVLPYRLIGAVWLLFWGLVGYGAKYFAGSARSSALLAHLIPGAVLLCLLYQELVLGRYWFNLLGVATQFYYLPLLNLAFGLENFLFALTGGWVHRMWYSYLIAFGLMWAAFYLGSRLRAHRTT